MERNFSNENFERFLQQNADGLRMRPSDKVWKGISRQLNRRRRRYGFILAFTLLVSSSLGYYLLESSGTPSGSQPVFNQKANSDIGQSPSSTATSSNTTAQKPNPVNTLNPDRNQNPALSPSIASIGQPVTGLQEMGITQTPVTSLQGSGFTPTVVDSYEFENSAPVTSTATKRRASQYGDPLTIESVLNSFAGKKKSKLGMQIYFTPTVSYRKLTENSDYIRSPAPVNNSLITPDIDDVNSAVTHKPDFGFELGYALKYPIAKNVKLRAGLQFNVNRYEIKTYNTSTELATIRMRNGIDSLNAVTNYNNFSGYKSHWLQNFYFQVSAPVGVELKLKGDEKMQFGIASTIQPTYMIGDRVYLISTDYKNYAEVPRLVRRWNVNTSLETFVAYSTGRLKWQVGPQVRYQLLSSFVKRYPVKENLFDFGLKVGVSLK
jgi:hypothetical protein